MTRREERTKIIKFIHVLPDSEFLAVSDLIRDDLRKIESIMNCRHYCPDCGKMVVAHIKESVDGRFFATCPICHRPINEATIDNIREFLNG